MGPPAAPGPKPVPCPPISAEAAERREGHGHARSPLHARAQIPGAGARPPSLPLFAQRAALIPPPVGFRSPLFSRHGNKSCPGLAFKSHGTPQAAIAHSHRHPLPAGTSIAPAVPGPAGGTFGARSGPNPDPFAPGSVRALHLKPDVLYKNGLYAVPAPLSVRPLSLRCVGGFYFQAERRTVKVSLHYSANGEMRLRSGGTATLRGPRGSCRGGRGADAAPASASAVPRRVRPLRRPDVATGSCSRIPAPPVSQYFFLPSTVFLRC